MARIDRCSGIGHPLPGLADHKLARVASLKDFRRVVNPFISWSGLTPDGFSLLMRDVGTQEVYALDFEAP